MVALLLLLVSLLFIVASCPFPSLSSPVLHNIVVAIDVAVVVVAAGELFALRSCR